MRKIYKALAIMTAIVTTFSACGKNSDNASVSNAGEYVADTNLNAPGEFPVCKNKITLKIGIPKDPLVTDYDTNLYTQAIKEKMNCDFGRRSGFARRNYKRSVKRQCNFALCVKGIYNSAQ